MRRILALLLSVLPGVLLAESAATTAESPAYILQLPATVTSVLIAETDTSTLYRYERSESGFELRDSRYMSIGQNGAGKERAWDRRTPLGIYFANERLDTSRMHEKYGPLAFALDYPNPWDQFKARTGDGIWIHGVAPGVEQRPAHDTDGCLALPNADLLELEAHMQLLATPVIITRRIREASKAEIADLRDEFSATLDSWATSYRDGDWHRYLSLYASDFEYHGLNKDEWSAYRVQSAATRPIRGFSIDDVQLLADPEEDDLYLSRFRQKISDAKGKIETIKRLYWRRGGDGAFRIVAEDNG